jgi:hypothetical protein
MGVHETHEHLAETRGCVRVVVDEHDHRHGAGAENAGIFVLTGVFGGFFAQRRPQLRQFVE